MNRKVVVAVVLLLFVVAAAFGIGGVAYNMGLAQGMVESGRVVAPVPGTPPFAYGVPGFYRPFGFGFGPFSCIFPILGFLFFFFLLRVLFWGGRGWGGGGGRWAGRRSEMFEQWHREAHAAPGASGAAPEAPASQPRRE